MKPELDRSIRRFALASSFVVVMFCTSWCRAEAPSAGNDALFQRLDADGNGALVASEVTAEHKQLFERLLRRAAADSDKSLSREEFIAALVPSRPEKHIETKQSSSYPQADAVRYLLLAMDTRKDSWIDADEVPDDMQPVYEQMVERLDLNKNGSIDRYELARGARDLGQLATRYVARKKIDVARELKRFDKSQGELAERFDKAPGPLLGNLGDPNQARKLFKQFDGNSDAKLDLDELPLPVQPQFERLMRFADRDRDGGLSEREFLMAAERISRVMSDQRPKPPKGNSKPDRKVGGRARLATKGVVPSDESMPAEDTRSEEP